MLQATIKLHRVRGPQSGPSTPEADKDYERHTSWSLYTDCMDTGPNNGLIRWKHSVKLTDIPGQAGGGRWEGGRGWTCTGSDLDHEKVRQRSHKMAWTNDWWIYRYIIDYDLKNLGSFISSHWMNVWLCSVNMMGRDLMCHWELTFYLLNWATKEKQSMHTLSNWEWWVKFTALGIYDPSEISIRALFYFILFFILWSVFYFFLYWCNNCSG